MDVFDRRREKLKVLLEEIPAAELARKSGVAASYISRCLKDPLQSNYKTIGEVTARKLEAGAGKAEGWLDELHTAPAPVPALASHSPAPTPAPGETGILVPMLDNSASMGAGAELHDEDVIAGTMALSPSFVHDHLRPTSAGALRFLHGYGDSMSPTFNSGDVLLVDTGVTDPKIDGIYVLQAHGRLFVKRVRQRLDGSHEISSDNPAHKTVDVLNGDHAIVVCGRVIWKWVGGKV